MAELVTNGSLIAEPVAHRTRAALEELPRSTSITIQQVHGGNNLNNGLTWSATVNLPASYLSPTPSPDEMIIRGRGRRSLPLEWSPIPVPVDSPQKRLDKTPVKRTVGRGLIVVRASPRKRLQLSDTPPSQLMESRKILMQMSPLVKKCRSMSMSPHQSPEVAIKGLSQHQLVNVLSHVITCHPELKDEISGILPSPDLRQIEEKLNSHKRSIFKALPTSRLASRTDSPAYARAAPHLVAFKKMLQEQGEQLIEAEQWESLVEYCLLAWSYVRATPVWDSLHHNHLGRRSSFKVLAQLCLHALKNVTWTVEQYEGVLRKLEQCRMEHEEMEQCIEQVKQRWNNV